jgi:hypothetical protein
MAPVAGKKIAGNPLSGNLQGNHRGASFRHDVGCAQVQRTIDGCE